MMSVHGPSRCSGALFDIAVEGAPYRTPLCHLAFDLGRALGDACAIVIAVVTSETKVEERT